MKTILNVALLFCTIIVQSQSYVGFLNDNYSGVHAVINNPANIVDSRLRTDINLFGISGLVDNDYTAVKLSDLAKRDFDFEESGENTPTNNNNGIMNLDVLGPSFMFNITPKHSFALSSRVRGFVNANDFNGNTIELIESEFNENNDYLIDQGNANSSVNSWGEIGVSYATILMDKGVHFLKGGLTLKYLQGLGSASGNGKNVSIDYDADGAVFQGQNVALITTTGTLNYGYTSNFDEEFEDFKIQEDANGFGADLGFVYEWRPDIASHQYKNKDGITHYYKNANKYKLKIGLSVTDIGSINYNDAKRETYDINEVFNEEEYKRLADGESISSLLQGLYGTPIERSNSLKANLPTAIHLSGDWNINNRFYLNLDTNFNIAGSDNNTSRIANSYLLTPRYETKWFSAFLPIGIYELSGFQTGFGFRAGPLYAGSGSVITNLINNKSKAIDVYVGLKVPIYQSRPKDTDGDGIFNKVDNCPEEAGPVENSGCPWGDADTDGVLDNEDKCVNVAGPKENGGCPWGDADEDGVLDNVDQCPNAKGTAINKGCPDTDGDGILDKEDTCPKEKGPAANNGCPYLDADGDGVLDKDDKCPKVAGVAKNNGCPEVIVITKEAEAKLNDFARAIYFNSGQTTFRQGVTGKLDLIVAIMNEYPKANFSIEGHTDSQGKKATNQRLSEKRAKAVLDYLVIHGISASRLSSYGFGEEYPIDSNATKDGRANNRRVEIKLKK